MRPDDLGAMNRNGPVFTPVRLWTFLLGFVLFLIPALTCRLAMTETTRVYERQGRDEALTANQATIRLMKSQGQGTFLIENRLDAFGMDVKKRLRGNLDLPTNRRVLTAMQSSLQNLRDGGIEPTRIVVAGFDKERPLASDSISVLFSLGCPAHELTFFRHILSHLLEDYFQADRPTMFPLPGELVTPFFSMYVRSHTMRGEMRARCIPVLLNGTPSFLFWDYLPVPLTPQPLSEPASADKYQPGQALFAFEMRRQTTLGVFLVIVPQVESADDHQLRPRLRLEQTLDLLDDSKAAVFLRFADGSPPLASRRFSQPPLASLLSTPRDLAIPSQIGEWSISTDTLDLDVSCEIIAASVIPPPPSSWQTRRGRFDLLLWLWLAGGIVLWGAASFWNRGLPTRLSRQILAGLIGACLLPSALNIFLVEPMVPQRLQTLEQAERARFRRLFEEMDQRAAFPRPAIFDQIRAELRNPLFLSAVASASHPVEPATQPWHSADPSTVREASRKIYRRLYDPPLDLSLRYLIITRPDGLTVQIPSSPTQPNEASWFSKIVQQAGLETIQALRGVLPGDANTTETSVKEAAKGEMMVETGRKMLHAIFGPNIYFHWLNDKANPVLMASGRGLMVMFQDLLPDAVRPDFLAVLFFKLDHSERWNLRRIMSPHSPLAEYPRHQDRRFAGRFFVFLRDYFGSSPFPEDANFWPELRLTARSMDFANVPVSLRIDRGNDTLLVEGAPSRLSNQFLFVGATSANHLKQQVNDLHGRLNLLMLATFSFSILLAIVVTGTLLRPIKALQEGIEAVERGDFTRQLTEDRTDELGEVFRAFNLMTRGLQERNILGRMVSTSAAQALATEVGEQQARAGERTRLLVAFLGARGFEEDLDRFAPEILAERLNRQIGGIVPAIRQAGGDVDKLVGGKMLAVFPAGTEAEARSSVRAVMQTLLQLASDHRHGKLPYDVVTGLHIDEVFRGVLGAGDRRDFTVIGDAVNMAARAETMAERYPDLLGIFTLSVRRHLPEGFCLETLGALPVKGKSATIDLFGLRHGDHRDDHSNSR
jgi:class 3 adenylate cyclase